MFFSLVYSITRSPTHLSLHPFTYLDNRISRLFQHPKYNTMSSCEGSNEYDGRMGVRVSSIFVILVASTFGQFVKNVSKSNNANDTQVPFSQ